MGCFFLFLFFVAHDAEDGVVGFFHALGADAPDVADGLLDVVLDDAVVVGGDALHGEEGGLYGGGDAGVPLSGYEPES